MDNTNEQSSLLIKFPFDNTYVKELPGFYVPCQPEPRATPTLVFLNEELDKELKLNLTSHDATALAAIFTGNQLPEGAEPIAQAYAGHQFGHFSPQLGDGRALIVGEVLNQQGNRFDICYKGSGRTPFTRGSDGKAALGPMLREVLLGEAMHALGVATTRALAVTSTGELVFRENALPGAVLTRVAASHIRIGTFQYFASRGQHDYVKRLADYSIRRHFPHLLDSENRYLEFLIAVSQRQAALVAHWMSLGFIHGVMNTDNMSIAGETIDYGPCAFMEHYNPKTVFSSIDEQGRYSYANQPLIAQWNLARLAETLLQLINDDQTQAIASATEVIETFSTAYQQQWLQRMRCKLGITPSSHTTDAEDRALIQEWLTLLHTHKIDFTLAFSALVNAAQGEDAPLFALFSQTEEIQEWLNKWNAHRVIENTSSQNDILTTMRLANPSIIPRNHLVEEALTAASRDNDLQPFEQLLAALKQPYSQAKSLVRYTQPGDESFTACYRTFCGT